MVWFTFDWLGDNAFDINFDPFSQNEEENLIQNTGISTTNIKPPDRSEEANLSDECKI